MDGKIQHYREFWHHYLREHGRPQTRALHYVGTAIALLLLVGALVFASLWLLLGAIVAGYFFAWIAHFTIERNRPATFTYPLWSLYSDFRMFFLWVSGRLPEHLKLAGVR